MALAELIPGRHFRLYRGTFPNLDYVAIATTLSLTTETTVTEAHRLDSQWADIGPGARSWSLELAGRADETAFRRIEADEAMSRPVSYRIMIASTIPRTYDGRIVITKLTRSMTDRGFVSFQATCKGSGPLDMQ